MHSLRSPLHDFDLPSRVIAPSALNRVLLCELGQLGYLSLRGRQDDAAFLQATAQILGCPLPCRPLQVLQTAVGIVLWLSPDEWLLVCRRSDRDPLLAALASALSELFAQVVDNSGGFTTLRVAGPDHLLLLRQLGPYDFESLAPGHCAATVLSKAGATVVRSDEAGVLLIFRRSFADYIWRLIQRTARPYHPCIVALGHCADPWFAPLVEIV